MELHDIPHDELAQVEHLLEQYALMGVNDPLQRVQEAIREAKRDRPAQG